jgi:hypothetical protein
MHHDRLLAGEEPDWGHYYSWLPRLAASPGFLQRYEAYLDQMVAFASALPRLQPQLTALTFRPLICLMLPAAGLEWGQRRWGRKLEALARLSGLKELLLWDERSTNPDQGWWRSGQLAALSGLVGLERLRVKAIEVDVAQLPPALTALTLVAGFLSDTRAAAAAARPGRQRASRPSRRPVARLPQLRQLKFEDVCDDAELGFQLLFPLLREAEVLDVDNLSAVDWASLALPASLRELTATAPWPGCARQLAPLQRLTSLKFSRRRVGADSYTQQELRAAAAAVQGLTQLRRLAVWPLPAAPGMPSHMEQQLRQALPWCSLDCAPLRDA